MAWKQKQNKWSSLWKPSPYKLASQDRYYEITWADIQYITVLSDWDAFGMDSQRSLV